MTTPMPAAATPSTPEAPPGPRPYQPPRLGGRQALEQVTLFSLRCKPGDPGCTIGHP
jgi:hypothetical protein